MLDMKSVNQSILASFLIILSSSVYAQNSKVAKVKNPSIIIISKEKIEAKIPTLGLSLNNAEIELMSIENANGFYYLLANTKDHDYTYIFKLKERRGKLLLMRSKIINACETSTLDMANYQVDPNGDVVGCNGLNHFVGKN